MITRMPVKAEVTVMQNLFVICGEFFMIAKHCILLCEEVVREACIYVI